MTLLRQLFYVLLIRPLLVIILGLRVQHLERLNIAPNTIIAANHNSHLDALVLMSLIKFRDIPKVKLVAAKDYFCKTSLRAWFSLNIIGIIPLDRSGAQDDPLLPIEEAIDQGYSVILFPEGTRGEPEKRKRLKLGIAKIVEEKPEISVIPVFLHGLGKSLPRGECLLVPMMCDVDIGAPITWNEDRRGFVKNIDRSFDLLRAEVAPKDWT
jgi:1-acyl-sn-glycerol-3-phosphate acyltransferase